MESDPRLRTATTSDTMYWRRRSHLSRATGALMAAQLERRYPTASPSNRRAQILVVSLGLLICVTLVPFLTGLLGALVLNVIFGRPNALLAARMGRRPAAVVVTLLAALLIVIPAIWLAMTLTEEAPATLYALEHGRIIEHRVDARGRPRCGRDGRR